VRFDCEFQQIMGFGEQLDEMRSSHFESLAHISIGVRDSRKIDGCFCPHSDGRSLRDKDLRQVASGDRMVILPLSDSAGLSA